MSGQPGMASRASQPGQASQGVDTALAAFATLTAAWPISTLLAEPSWVGGTLLLMVTISVSGFLARSRALGHGQIMSVQLVCFVLAAGTIYAQGHLWHGLPTLETVRHALRLVGQAISTAQAYAAPAPTTTGLIFVVGCSLGLTALTVDYLAVTCRSPSMAGLPLLTAFLAATANSGSALPVKFFLAAATVWLIMVARAGNASLRRWATTNTMARTPTRQRTDYRGMYEYASIARKLGAVALVAAVAMPAILPQSTPKFLTTGLGRSSADTSGSGAVGLSLSLDLSSDLKNTSTAPVLRYKTADTSPPPLRVAVSSFYRSEAGLWLPWGRPLPILSPSPVVPEPVGLSREVPRKTFVTTFTNNLLDAPNLATPYPLVAAQLNGTEWGSDEEAQSVRVAQRPDTYTASYWRLEPTPTMLLNAPSLSQRERRSFDLDLALDGPYVERVTALSDQLTSGMTAPYEKAMAIQQYLRATGGFRYSLTLARPPREQSRGNARADPLSSFLITKQGYCVQFATAMTMLARAADIPARMAIGFLPGTRGRNVWSVTASDAHAWPELYIEGLGWTRFEPTPSRGAPPSYALPEASLGGPAEATPTAAPTAAPTTSSRPDLADTPAGAGGNQDVGLSPAAVLRRLTTGWGAAVLGILIGLLGSLVVPTAARLRRRRQLTSATTDSERVEVQWEQLTSDIGDLGIAPSPSSTPRQLRAYYDREAFLDAESSLALGRVVQTLESSRYAVSPPSAPALDGFTADAEQVLKATAANRRGRDRLRAALWPDSGITELRSVSADVAWRVRDLQRRLGDRVGQRFSGALEDRGPAEPGD